MSLKFKFIPLTFQKDEDEIKKQIRNTIILRHLFEESNKTVPLKSLIESTQYGYNASALLSGKNKFLRISDITDGKVDWETVPYCDCDSEDTYLLYTNDLLIARTGGTTGKSFLITNPPEHSIYAGYLIRIRANEDAEPLFLNLFLNSYVYWSQIVSLNEGEFRPSVNANTLKSLTLPKCSLEKQLDAIKISNNEYIKGYEELISDIDKAISDYEQCKQIEIESSYQLNLISQLKQSILLEAINGKLTKEWRKQNSVTESAIELLKRIKAEKQKLVKEGKLKKEKEVEPIPESEIQFKLPESWIWCRLGNIVQHNAGKTLHKGNNTGILKDYLTTSNVYWGYFKLDNVKQIQIEPKEYERCTASKGDLLICEGGDVGRSAIWNEDYEICIQNHIHRVRPYCEVNSKYIYYYMNYLHSNNLILDYKKGMGIGNLSGTALASIKLTLPPLEEQQAIVEKVDLLMDKCLKLSQEIETLDKHGKTLMKAMFNETFETKTEECQD